MEHTVAYITHSVHTYPVHRTNSILSPCLLFIALAADSTRSHGESQLWSPKRPAGLLLPTAPPSLFSVRRQAIRTKTIYLANRITVDCSHINIKIQIIINSLKDLAWIHHSAATWIWEHNFSSLICWARCKPTYVLRFCTSITRRNTMIEEKKNTQVGKLQSLKFKQPTKVLFLTTYTLLSQSTNLH